VSSTTANGIPATDEPPTAATAAGRLVRMSDGTRRRVDAARAGSAQRVPQIPPSRASLWAVRVVAALMVALLGVLLVVLVSWVL
jgi:hypothetical protein